MKNYEIETVKAIAEDYTTKSKEKTDIERLESLDKKVKRPAKIFAYVFGTFGTLVLGTGMCMAMKVILSSMAVGIGIGLVGIAAVCVTYPLYKKILKARKKKYASQILELSNALLSSAEN